MILRTPKDVGAFIRERRKKLALDQSSLAERVGVSRQWLIEVERGKPSVSLQLILRTLLALGARLAVEDEPSPKELAALELPDIDAIVENARKRRRR